MKTLTYAIVGGPPEDWRGLVIVDLETGREVRDVVEVNSAEGWLIRFRRNEQGHVYLDPDRPDEAARERLTGKFEIRYPV